MTENQTPDLNGNVEAGAGAEAHIEAGTAKIKKTASKVKAEAQEAAADIRAEAEEAAADLKGAAEDIGARAQEAAQDVAEEVAEAVKATLEQEPVKAFLDHQKRAIDEAGKAIEALLPEGFRTHGREARREFAQGLKILVDAAVAELEKASREVDARLRRTEAEASEAAAEAGEAPRPSTTGAQKVKVKVD